MTNEQFLTYIKFANTANDYEISEVFQHAKKLVAVAEAAKKLNTHLNNHDLIRNHSYVHEDLNAGLENLERE